jgi:DNA-binding NarL/FixJ family response regulator
VRVELARARLLYGEWLRREHRRVDAREQLRAAHQMFTTMGAEAFAERARGELLAKKPRSRALARDGRTNPEIGAQLFISPRTVEWHLRNVFTKLGIRSRRDLHDTLPDRPPAHVSA